MSKKETTTAQVKSEVKKQADFIFEKSNYQLMLVGIAFIVVGYFLMSGGAPKDPNTFNHDEIFSTTRITIAPILVLIGFVIEIFAIMHKPKN